MARTFTLPESAIAIRSSATAPEHHAWVSANAGSGKTAILKDRVMRLLLDGVPPDRILCLTYTRAAAAEMQSRIFSELAGWTAMAEADLATAIDRLCGVEPTRREQRVARARQLFAAALETPGGLKIQTIHAFAERILHLFPIEAGVPFDFTMLDETDRAVLVEEARRQVLDDALAFPESGLGRAFRTITEATGADAFQRVVDLAIRTLAQAKAQSPDEPLSALMGDARYAAVLGLPVQTSAEEIAAEFVASIPDRVTLRGMADRIAALNPKKPTKLYVNSIEQLRALAAAPDDLALLKAAINFVFTSDREKPRDSVVDAATVKGVARIADEIETLQTATIIALERLRLQQTSARSRALAAFAGSVLERVEAAKAARAVLDFDDLIARLAAMLRRGAAAWVMRKLDGAIEHVLVDEAQDTTPQMWEIIRALADDFFSGDGQSRYRRTLFVVGDEKQSIFSFQGARPHVFDEVRQSIAARFDPASDAGRHIRQPVALRYSFRSSGDVLAAIDRIFAGGNADGLTAEAGALDHVAADEHMPGLVECWPAVMPPPKDKDAPEPPIKINAALMSARQIADRIEAMLDGERHLSDGMPILPGDILVLAQHRNAFFNGLIRELRQRGIPVAGADRLKLETEIVIHDLLAIAQASMQPADDLVLASALKSPLFGLDDRTLERVCRGRSGSLRAALHRAAQENADLAEVDLRLATLEARRASLSPYVFFARLLVEPIPGSTGMSGRKAILSRLGPDARDPLDAFLGQALEFGLVHPPTLAGFLHKGRAGSLEIKRDLDSGGGQVRVMTVHASKGLEARIVFVGDAMRMPDQRKEPECFLSEDGRGVLLWSGMTKGQAPAPLREVRGRSRILALQEHRRLLYVAMTRASERLILTGFRSARPSEKAAPKSPLETDWLTLAREAFASADAERIRANHQEGDILRWRSTRAPRTAEVGKVPGRPAQSKMPPWLGTPLPAEASDTAPISPSRMESEAGNLPLRDPGDGAREDAIALGTVLHRLLDVLPQHEAERRHPIGARMLVEGVPHLSEIARARSLAAVLAAINGPETARFFAAGSRAEVPVAGTIPLRSGAMQRIIGRIDRLRVTQDDVDILDIKTGRPGCASEDGAILRQIALYRHVIGTIFPGHRVRAYVLWLQEQRLELLASELLDNALASITER